MAKKVRIEFIPTQGTTHVPETSCPGCGKALDAASSTYHRDLPAPGQPTICLYCGELLIFDDRMRLRQPNKAELRDLQQDREVWGQIEATQRKFRAAGIGAFVVNRKRRERTQ